MTMKNQELNHLIDSIGKANKILMENGACIPDKEIIIKRDEDEYLQATVIVSLNPKYLE